MSDSDLQLLARYSRDLKFLDKFAWLHAADRKLETEDDFRAAFADLGELASSASIDVIRDKVMAKYRPEHGGEFPKDISELKPYFEDPVDSGLLDRYQIAEAKDYPQTLLAGSSTGGWVITEKNKTGAALHFLQGGGVDGSVDMATLAPVLKAAFETAPTVNGIKTMGRQDLEPYLTTDEQKAAYQRLRRRAQ